MPEKSHDTGLGEEGGAQEEQLQQGSVAAGTGGGRPWQRQALGTWGAGGGLRMEKGATGPGGQGGRQEGIGSRRKGTQRSGRKEFPWRSSMGGVAAGASHAEEKPVVSRHRGAIARRRREQGRATVEGRRW